MMDAKNKAKPVTALVVGASGNTGRLLVKELLNRGVHVKMIIRSLEKMQEDVKNHPHLSIIHANILELCETEMAHHVHGCNAVASCLGHNMTLKGIFGHPRMLVTDATRKLCDAIKENNPEHRVKFVLMNTAGNSNRDIPERVSFAQRCITSVIRLLLPPHLDNERAADYLRTEIRQDHNTIEWAVVRPDSLKDEDQTTAYNVYDSPTRSAIFNPGVTTRINVAHFMADLIVNAEQWHNWKGKMPVIYNKVSP